METVVKHVCGRCGSDKTIRRSSKRHLTFDGVWIIYYRCRNCNATFRPQIQKIETVSLAAIEKNIVPYNENKIMSLKHKGRPRKNMIKK